MSTRVSRGPPPKGGSRSSQRRKMVLEVDLNVPPCDNCSEVGTSSHAPVILELQAGQQGPSAQPTLIDVDSFDDDVILSSPRAFAEAKNNSRRNQRRTNVVDVDLDSAVRHVANNRNKRQRLSSNQPIINCELFVNLERNGLSASKTGNSLQEQSGSKVPVRLPPQEPTFSCPVCMGPLVDEMSTKCGHIFCKACIKRSIAAQGKCPTCRRKVTMKDTIRIYLPATSLT